MNFRDIFGESEALRRRIRVSEEIKDCIALRAPTGESLLSASATAAVTAAAIAAFAAGVAGPTCGGDKAVPSLQDVNNSRSKK
jgi:hypothetical protein